MNTKCEVLNGLEIFGERLVKLCNGQPGLRAGLLMEIREPAEPSDAESPTLDFIASDETLDRYGEILVASGWRLDQYRRNPVFQNAHQYGDVIFTLGKALTTEIRGGKLCQRIEFATEVNPLAKIAYGLYRGHFLNAVSVGFVPIRWENGSAEAGYGRKYLEQELLEVSAVCIPANPNALQMGLKAGVIEKADLQHLADLLQLIADHPTKVGRSVSAAPFAPTFGIPIRWLQSDGDLSDQPEPTLLDGQSVAPETPSIEQFRSNRTVGETGGATSGAAVCQSQVLLLAAVLRDVLRRA